MSSCAVTILNGGNENDGLKHDDRWVFWTCLSGHTRTHPPSRISQTWWPLNLTITANRTTAARTIHCVRGPETASLQGPPGMMRQVSRSRPESRVASASESCVPGISRKTLLSRSRASVTRGVGSMAALLFRIGAAEATPGLKSVFLEIQGRNFHLPTRRGSPPGAGHFAASSWRPLKRRGFWPADAMDWFVRRSYDSPLSSGLSGHHVCEILEGGCVRVWPERQSPKTHLSVVVFQTVIFVTHRSKIVTAHELINELMRAAPRVTSRCLDTPR